MSPVVHASDALMVVERAARTRRAHPALAGIIVVAPLLIATSAAEVDIDRPAVERAIQIGRGDLASRDRFHEAYRIRLGGPLIERLEVITEFHRVVLVAEQHASLAAGWGYTQAIDFLQPFRERVALILKVAFPPQNAYRTMEPFDLAIYARPGPVGSRLIEPISIVRTPRYVNDQVAPPGSPIVGGTVEALFELRQLNPRGSYLVGIFDQNHELQRVEVDLSRFQ
jgi:hypothetical protein